LITPVWPTAAEFLAVVAELGPDQLWVFDSETDGLLVRGDYSRDRAWYVGFSPCLPDADKCYCFDVTEEHWLHVKSDINRMRLIAHNGRFDVHALDLDLEHGWLDTMALQYRWNTSGSSKTLDSLAHRYGRYNIPTPPELKGKKGEQNQIGVLPVAKLAKYMANDIEVTSWLWLNHFTDRQKAESVNALDPKVERTVQRMERRGVRLLEGPLEALGQKLGPLVSQNEAVLRGAGFTGNLNSPKQLAEWLQSFTVPTDSRDGGEALRYNFWRNTWVKNKQRKERKYVTNSKLILEPFFDRTGDSIIGALTQYRKLLKKKRDFCDMLPTFIHLGNGMVHGAVKTMHTSTTRFSHATPNLAQIPKQGHTSEERALAKAFRACFTGESGWVSGADFSQVELRVAAALSGDSRMLEAFDRGEDPHSSTAAGTSGCRIDALPPGERFKAKATNFGILNGMKAARLAVNIRTTATEAQRFIDKHISAHPELHGWMREVTEAAGDGHCQSVTLDNAHMIHSKKDRVNNAVSLHVQGNAAGLMRHALVAVEAAGLRPILTVHDEIVGDIRGKGQEYADVMQEAANAAYPEALGVVDFVAKGGDGRTWADV